MLLVTLSAKERHCPRKQRNSLLLIDGKAAAAYVCVQNSSSAALY